MIYCSTFMLIMKTETQGQRTNTAKELINCGSHSLSGLISPVAAFVVNKERKNPFQLIIINQP